MDIGQHRPNKRRDRLQDWLQLVKFNLVGLLNTAIDFGLFTLLSYAGMLTWAAQIVSYSAGVVNSFLCNKYWTFAERKQGTVTAAPGQALRFGTLNLVSLGLSLGLLHLFQDLAGFGPLASKAIVTIFTTAVNFLGSRQWVFKNQTT